jgi:hypothetical protein
VNRCPANLSRRSAGCRVIWPLTILVLATHKAGILLAASTTDHTNHISDLQRLYIRIAILRQPQVGREAVTLTYNVRALSKVPGVLVRIPQLAIQRTSTFKLRRINTSRGFLLYDILTR